jgi:hypothetical protein
MGTFGFDDLAFMEYEFVQVAENVSVQKYLEELDRWYRKRKIPGPPFPSFQRTAALLRKHQLKAIKSSERSS